MKTLTHGHGAPLKILLVEDDPAHAELIIRSFDDHPIANDIRHVSDGEEALAYLFRRGTYDTENSPRPNVILLDLRLPRIDGLDVLKEIRASKELDEIPVVILTTSRAETDVDRAYQHHANSYLVKPLDFATFTKMMNVLGFYWLTWNHYPGRMLGDLAV